MNAPQPGSRVKVEIAGSTAEVLFSSLHFERAFRTIREGVRKRQRFTKGTADGAEGP